MSKGEKFNRSVRVFSNDVLLGNVALNCMKGYAWAYIKKNEKQEIIVGNLLYKVVERRGFKR